MSKREFTHGQLVEIQRDTGALWEPVTYDKPMLGNPESDWHVVKFPPSAAPRHIEGHMPSGNELHLDVWWICVPSRRIRVKL